MIDAYRIDGQTPPMRYPYRVRVDGELLRTTNNEPRRFRTLAEACAAGKAEQKEIL